MRPLKCPRTTTRTSSDPTPSPEYRKGHHPWLRKLKCTSRTTSTDDLDGESADDTIQFSLDGKNYEIDLSATNAERLWEALRPFADAARKTTRSGGACGTRSRASGGAPDTAQIRTWEGERPRGLRPRTPPPVREGRLLHRPRSQQRSQTMRAGQPSPQRGRPPSRVGWTAPPSRTRPGPPGWINAPL